MVPVYGAVWAIIALVRWWSRRKGGKGAALPRVYPRVPLWKWSLVAAGLCTLWYFADPTPERLALVLVTLTLGALPLLVRGFVVPLGLPRVAWALYRFAGGTGSDFEQPGSAAFVAARAFMRRPSEAGARFLEGRLKTCLEIGTSGAAAAALLALWRGNREQSVAIFRLVDSMGSRHPSGPRSRRASVWGLGPAFRLARDHLAVDALARQQWRKLGALDVASSDGFGPPLTQLLAAVGRRFAYAEGRPSSRALWARRLGVPHRAATRLVVQAALAAPPPPPPARVGPTFAAQVALLACDPDRLRAEDVAAAVSSLDQLRVSTSWLARIEQRALALGITVDAATVGAATMREAEADVAAALLAGEWPATWAPAGLTGDAVRARLREERLRQAETLVTDLLRRTRAGRDLPEPDEWRAWADAKRVCDLLRTDGVEAMTIFPILHSPLTAYGVRLVNVRSRRVLARDVFAYVRDFAYAAGAVHAYAGVDRNVQATNGYRLPRQSTPEGTSIGDRIPLADWLEGRVLRLALAAVALILLAEATRWSFALAIVAMTLLLFRIRVVQCQQSEDGLVIQSGLYRHIAALEDIRAIHAGPGGLVRIRLRRSPSWLGPRLLTIAKTAGEARTHVARVRGAIGQKPGHTESPASAMAPRPKDE